MVSTRGGAIIGSPVRAEVRTKHVPTSCGPRNQWGRRPEFPALAQPVIMSVQDFCHWSATCIQNCMGFVAPIWKTSAPGQLPNEPKPGGDFSFCSIAAGEAFVGFGNFSCSSQASII